MAVKPDEELMLAADPIEDVAAGTEEELKTYDGDILHALLAAANYQQSEDETYTMRVVRKKVVLFTFRVCPLSEEQYDRCREKNTKYVRNSASASRCLNRQTRYDIAHSSSMRQRFPRIVRRSGTTNRCGKSSTSRPASMLSTRF